MFILRRSFVFPSLFLYRLYMVTIV